MTSWFIFLIFGCNAPSARGKLCNQAARLGQQITAPPVGLGIPYACVGASPTNQPSRRMRP
jgi:uncharacterized metal-binding protein